MPRPLRLLLVEDSPSDSALLVRHLEREGLTIDARRVETKPEMIAALQSGPWDLVVSDYGLPRFSGLEAIATAVAFDPDLPVILVSGTVGEETAAEVMRAGARDFLLKGSLARLAMAMERELTEAQLRRGRRREAQVMLQTQAIARAGGWEWSRSTDELFVTEGVTRLLDAPADHRFTVASAAECLAPGERAKLENALRSAGEVLDLDVRALTLTGREVTVRVVARVERHEGKLHRLVGAALDVSEQRVMEASLRLKDRLIAMGTIAAGVAHEINNPLTHLVASLPMVLDAVKKAPPVEGEVRELLEGCIDGAQRIAAIVRDLRVFSRPDESGTDSDVGEVLGSVLKLLNLEYRHAARIDLDVPAGLLVAAPSARLAQVFTNLIINAVQAMPQRPSEQNRIEVTARPQGDSVLIEVSDNGSGIAEPVLSRLFVPFFTTKPVGEGTGLGLSVCRTIVTGLGGTIDVSSRVGVGTTFRVRLPSTRVAAETPAPPEPSAEPSPQRPMRVLLVDDEPVLRLVTNRLLAPNEVVEAGSAEEGMAVLERDTAFDVVLCDLMMPGRSGIDFFKDVTRRSPQFASRFIFVSGGAVSSEASAFLAAFPRERVLLKPYTAHQLFAVIEQVGAGGRA